MHSPVEDHIPEPRVFLMGCQPWPPPPRPDGSCPVCGSGIRPEDTTYHCGVCGSSAPQIEARCLAARIGLRSKSSAEMADKKARDELRRLKKMTLSETTRRRIWNGYKGGIENANPEPTNRAKIGRDWLMEIGQIPSAEFFGEAA